MKRIYIAGKLNDQAVYYIQNLHKMIKEADAVRRAGFSVFIPCLDLLSGIFAGDYEYKTYFDNNISWVDVSDAVYVCPGYESSQGTLKEIARARQLGIPVYYSIEDLINMEGEGVDKP